jgi:hypothetical protein
MGYNDKKRQSHFKLEIWSGPARTSEGSGAAMVPGPLPFAIVCRYRRVKTFFVDGATQTIIILMNSIRLSEYSLTGLSLNEYTQGSYAKN